MTRATTPGSKPRGSGNQISPFSASPGGEGPIVGERLLQSGHNRAFHAKMQILNRAPGLRGQYVAVTDVHAAGEPRVAVHDQDFAVIAQIDRRHAPGRKQGRRQEFCTRNLQMLQLVGDGRPRVTRAGSVNQNAHGHPAPDGAAERVGKLFPARVIVENIGDQRNGFCGGLNCRQHGRKRFVAVDERMHMVAGGQRLLDDATDDAREHFQVCRAFVFRFPKVLGNPVVGGFVHAEQHGAAADAIDARARDKAADQPPASAR